MGNVWSEVFIKIPDGSLKVQNHSGPLRVHGGQGSVRIGRLYSEYFEVRTRAGSVEVSQVELARGRGQIETESGSVSIIAGDKSSFRYYLDSRSGTIAGFPSGQVK